MRCSSQDIINLTRIGTHDGGSQTACCFLQELSKQGDVRDYFIVAFKNTDAGRLTEELGFENILIGRNLRERAYWDLFCRRFFKKGQLCLTFHGVPWLRSKDYLINLSGVADSNLYYPEIPFWKHCSIPTQALKFLKDRGRMLGYSRADYWLFETDTLAERAIDLARYPEQRVAVVKMSVSTWVSPAGVDQATSDGFKRRIGNGFSFLFLAGANPNKRIVEIGPALAEVRAGKMTDAPLKVVTTLDPRSGYYHALRREFQRLHVDDAWVNIGPLAHADVPSLIQACDVVCLFSVLESFSSNFTEAWAMKKPLLVSDADWARSACGKAAMYVSPTDVSRLADALIRLTRPAVQAELLKQYGRHFRAYPTAEGRCRQYLECMETARRLGCISTAESKSLRQFRCGRAA